MQCKTLRFYCNICDRKTKSTAMNRSVSRWVINSLSGQPAQFPRPPAPSTCSMGWNIVCMKPGGHLVTRNKWQMLRGGGVVQKYKQDFNPDPHIEVQQLTHETRMTHRVFLRALSSPGVHPGRRRWRRSHVVWFFFFFFDIRWFGLLSKNAHFAFNSSALRAQKQIYDPPHSHFNPPANWDYYDCFGG